MRSYVDAFEKAVRKRGMEVRGKVEGAVYTLLGALIGTSSGIIITWINRRYDEKKHKRELAVKVGIEDWKQNVDLFKWHADKGKGGVLQPLLPFIVNINTMADLIFEDRDVEPDEIHRRLDRMDRIVAVLRAHQQWES